MSAGDRERWDAKHAHARAEPSPPDRFVVAALERLGAGAGRRAVDLASGTGRHALELARRGWSVEAWDVSPVALEHLARRASDAGLELATRVVDLVGAELPAHAHAYELVVVVNFLERPLLARLPELVAPAGQVLFATFTVDRPGTRPPLEFCLERGELARGLEGFETLVVEEAGGRAGLLASRAPA